MIYAIDEGIKNIYILIILKSFFDRYFLLENERLPSKDTYLVHIFTAYLNLPFYNLVLLNQIRTFIFVDKYKYCNV